MKFIKLFLIALLTMYADSLADQSLLGFHQAQGRRITMEDAHNYSINPNHAFFAIYDGHGGRAVADFAADHLHNEIAIEPSLLNSGITVGLQKAFVNVNNNLDAISGKGFNQGCTAIVAYFKDKKLYIANAGDSRAVLSSNGHAIALSKDHKPNDPHEKSRIEKLGGAVINIGVARVNGKLAVARALGDKDLHPYVIPNPEVHKRQLADNDEFLILACDGLWDVIDNQTAVDSVQHVLLKQREQRLQPDFNQAAQMLVNMALQRGSKDNISVMIINVQKFR